MPISVFLSKSFLLITLKSYILGILREQIGQVWAKNLSGSGAFKNVTKYISHKYQFSPTLDKINPFYSFFTSSYLPPILEAGRTSVALNADDVR